jgi:integrase
VNQVKKYLDSKKNAWSPSTIKSEGYRLKRLAPLVTKQPVEVFEQMRVEGYDAYGIKTAFIRLGEYYSFVFPTKANPFKLFVKENANYFKRAYQSKPVPATFEEVTEKIVAITNEAVREKARQLLLSGMRWTESHTVDEHGYVTGKGGKRRRVFAAKVGNVSYYAVYKELKQHGITPHMLRKLFATKLGDNKDVTPQDLCKLMGWEDISTAYRYLQPKDEARLAGFVQGVAK